RLPPRSPLSLHDALPIWFIPALTYSYLKASMGSTRVARRAGSQVASNAIAISKSETPANEAGSRGLSPNSVAESARETPAEARRSEEHTSELQSLRHLVC